MSLVTAATPTISAYALCDDPSAWTIGVLFMFLLNLSSQQEAHQVAPVAPGPSALSPVRDIWFPDGHCAHSDSYQRLHSAPDACSSERLEAFWRPLIVQAVTKVVDTGINKVLAPTCAL